MRVGSKEVPRALEPTLKALKDRIKQLKQQYRSLAAWGRPFFFSEKEVAVVYYVNSKLGVSLAELANFLGVDKTSLYKIVKKIEREGRASIYNPDTNKVEVVDLDADKAIDIVEREFFEIEAKAKMLDPFKSARIQEFLQKPIRKRAHIKGHPVLLSDKQKMHIVRIVERIMYYIRDNFPEMPVNPDFWTEDQLIKVFDHMREHDNIEFRTIRRYMIMLRSIPAFREWFKGLMGATKNVSEPKDTIMTIKVDGRDSIYQAYLKIKRELDEKEWLIIALHIATGAREGFKQCVDLEDCKSSLAGLRWENVSWRGELYEDSCVIKIWESKTQKWWRADLGWLDKDICKALRKYARERGNIIKTITGIDTTRKFVSWYNRLLAKVSKILELPYRLRPHDMRRTSLSLKAELGIPIEQALTPQLPLGVGWETIDTAIHYYLRFSSTTKERLKLILEQAKKELGGS